MRRTEGMPTTYRDPDGWPRPQRLPQHAAAPFARSSPYRLQASKALRLAMLAGTWAAGLCLVIGSIALVASAASPSKIAKVNAASASRPDREGQQSSGHRSSGQRSSGQRSSVNGSSGNGSSGHRAAPARRRAGPPAARVVRADLPARLIAAFAGHGSQTTRQFRVDDQARWQIQWAYNCPSTTSQGLLVVEDAYLGAVNTSISQTGAAGRGDTWLNPDGQTQRLVVISTCSWTMKVMQ
jgi:hypothetical protein